VRELLHVAIADFAPGLVAFPDQAGVAGLLEALCREAERRIPAPAIGAGHAHALVQQEERRLAPETAAAIDEVGLAIGLSGRRIHEHDVARLALVADAVERALHLVGAADMAVGLVEEIELDRVV